MLTIILALVIGTLLFFAIATVCANGADVLGLFLVVGLTIGAVIVAVFGAISGYDEPEVAETVAIEPLRGGYEEEEKLLYAQITTSGVGYCKIRVTDSAGEELYKLQKLPQNVEVFEEDTCKATLYKIVAKGKKTVWTFSVGTDITTYVLVVPKGTVQVVTVED